jgi:hypothetical protein
MRYLDQDLFHSAALFTILAPSVAFGEAGDLIACGIIEGVPEH